MPTKEPEDDLCGARIRPHRVPEEWEQDVGYCANRSGFRTTHFGEGRCYLHGGATRNVNRGNNHAEKHGLYAERQNYYNNRSRQEQQWIDAVVESLLDDAPFSPESFAKLQMLRNIAIDMHKQQRANDYIDDVGVVERDKTIGYTEQGKPILEDQENALNIAYDRLTRTTTRQLKELGLLDDPESQKAEAQTNIARELSALRAERDVDE